MQLKDFCYHSNTEIANFLCTIGQLRKSIYNKFIEIFSIFSTDNNEHFHEQIVYKTDSLSRLKLLKWIVTMVTQDKIRCLSAEAKSVFLNNLFDSRENTKCRR